MLYTYVAQIGDQRVLAKFTCQIDKVVATIRDTVVCYEWCHVRCAAQEYRRQYLSAQRDGGRVVVVPTTMLKQEKIQ